ncbi:MAG: sensor histidine kinase [Phenylobacterium sp.]
MSARTIGRRAAASDSGESLIVDDFDAMPDRQAMIAAELHHRVQNTLAIVLALARLTARSVTTIDEFQVAFADRVQAMARTNALLLRGQAQAIDVRAALETELEPYWGRGDEILLECEPLNIVSEGALSLSLLIHELATNAAKYGALSSPGGRLIVDCVRGPGGGVLTWNEISVNPVKRPTRKGAGSLLIERLARDLGGTAVLTFRRRGLLAIISFSLDPAALARRTAAAARLGVSVSRPPLI